MGDRSAWSQGSGRGDGARPDGRVLVGDGPRRRSDGNHRRPGPRPVNVAAPVATSVAPDETGSTRSPDHLGETVELRELRVFLTLAEELHFGHSARRLGLTSSRVSQSLRDLERKLGGQLLHRTSRRVRLTPFGEHFLVEARPAYDELADVLARARAANHRLEGTLRFGLLLPPAGGPHLHTIIEAFEHDHPDCEVQVSEVLLDDPLGPLRRGEIDVMAMRLPINCPDMVVGPTLSSEPRVLQVARGHPLATRREVSIEDIADYDVIALDGFPTETIEAVIPHRTPTGRTIRRRRISPMPRTPFEVEALIARGIIVNPTVPSYAGYSRHPGIVHIPIGDMPPSSTGLIWQRRTTDPRIREFVRTTRHVLATRQERAARS
jgi:DNA-binding transcriptional LysR family regulator